MSGERKAIRVMVAKMGLDTHDVGAKVVAQGLRDAGMEVIYLGMRHTPRELAAIAVEEDADIVGVSILSGAHRSLVTGLLRALEEAGLDNVKVAIGGTIPDRDAEEFSKDRRVLGVFGPGSSINRIVAAIQGSSPTGQEARVDRG
jgi:methylmalonyl-CoA mutase C-terminal domain/subunit